MKTANKAAAFATLNTFADSRVALIQGMIDAGYATLEECRPIVIEWACSKTGGEFNTHPETGKVTLVSSHAKYNTTKTVLRDIMLMIAGTTRREADAKTEEGAETKEKKAIDPVDQAIKAYMKLTPAQRKKFAKVAAGL